MLESRATERRPVCRLSGPAHVLAEEIQSISCSFGETAAAALLFDLHAQINREFCKGEGMVRLCQQQCVEGGARLGFQYHITKYPEL